MFFMLFFFCISVSKEPVEPYNFVSGLHSPFWSVTACPLSAPPPIPLWALMILKYLHSWNSTVFSGKLWKAATSSKGCLKGNKLMHTVYKFYTRAYFYNSLKSLKTVYLKTYNVRFGLVFWSPVTNEVIFSKFYLLHFGMFRSTGIAWLSCYHDKPLIVMIFNSIQKSSTLVTIHLICSCKRMAIKNFSNYIYSLSWPNDFRANFFSYTIMVMYKKKLETRVNMKFKCEAK